MIRQISTTAFILFAVFTMWSCTQSDTKEALPKKVYAELSGQYILVQRYYSNLNGMVTPEHVDYSEKISINNNGLYQTYRDGKKIAEQRYLMSKYPALVGHPDSVYLMTLDYESPNCEDVRTFLQLKNDTLFTRSIWSGAMGKPDNSMTTCVDCTRSVYVRQQEPTTNPIAK